MRPLAVDLVLLRQTAPDLPLVIGRVLAARVVERHGRHGILSLAGAYLTAELPDDVEVGDRLRLVVQDTSGGRATFVLAEGPPSGAQVPPSPLAQAPLADDRVVLSAREGEREDPGEPQPDVVTVRFEGAALGTVELRVALDEQLVHARVAFAGEPAAALARERSSALRAALGAAANRDAEVEIRSRLERVDVYG